MELKPSSADFLKKLILARKEKNASLSLRSLAKKLQISPSYLSKMLNGQKPLSISLLPRMKAALQLDELTLQSLQQKVLREVEQKFFPLANKTTTVEKTQNLHVTDEYKNLSAKDFWILEHWSTLAIYNFFSLNHISFESKEDAVKLLAKTFKIHESTSRTSLGLLVAHGYLKKTETGYTQSTKKLRFPTSQSHEAVRNFHSQHLKKNIKELETQTSDKDFHHRLITGITFAGDSEKIEAAKTMIHEALYKAAEFLADGESSNEVFHLSLQLSPLTNTQSNDSKNKKGFNS